MYVYVDIRKYGENDAKKITDQEERIVFSALYTLLNDPCLYNRKNTTTYSISYPKFRKQGYIVFKCCESRFSKIFQSS